MHLELQRDEAKAFPRLDDPAAITSARIWMCKYRSLVPVGALSNVEVLEIANYPDATLEPIGRLSELVELRMLHLPKVDDLSPLSKLRGLRRLALETLPSWDASGRVTEVQSLEPLAGLPNLERLTLYGLVPADRSVDPILRSRSVREVRVSKYPDAEIERLLGLWYGPPPRGRRL